MEEAKGKDYAADGVRVIFSGKVLKDEDTLGAHGFKDGGFVVVMPGKVSAGEKKLGISAIRNTTCGVSLLQSAKPAAPPAAASTPAASAAPSAAAATPSAAAATVRPPAPPAAAPAASSALVNPQAVESVVAMGFPRSQAEAALRAAFGNVDRAIEYLTSVREMASRANPRLHTCHSLTTSGYADGHGHERR